MTRPKVVISPLAVCRIACPVYQQARVAALLVAVAVWLALSGVAAAYNCSGTPWQAITVTPSNLVTSSSSDYTLSTHVPNVSGCDLTTNTEITVTWPGDTDAGSITGGTLNGTPISTFITRFAQTVTFTSPVAVAFNQQVIIVLTMITNPSTPGSKTLSMSGTHSASGGAIGSTTSGQYSIVLPTATPTSTPTATATLTPTATASPTSPPTSTFTVITATPTLTPTFTPTPGPCTSFGLANPCIPGAGLRSTDCFLEWVSDPVPPRKFDRTPKNRLACYQGDPACDFGAEPDGCLFHTRLCINNSDPRLPTCTRTDIVSFQVKSPIPASAQGVDAANLTTLETQGSSGFGVVVLRGAKPQTVGTTNAVADECSATVPLQVPLRRFVSGKVARQSKRFVIKVVTSEGKSDTDTLTLECRPSTCGNGTVQSDHEACDDSNRTNGDGCDQGCHVEPGFTCSGQPSVCVRQATPTTTTTPTATQTPTITPSGLPSDTPGGAPTPTGTPTSSSMTTPTASPTPTQGTAVCGNGQLEAGETCDDGNTITNPPNDTCPADCTTINCATAATSRTVSVSFTPPAGKSVSSMTVLLEYPDGTVQIPGTGSDDPVPSAISNTPGGALVAVFDFDYALRVNLVSTAALTPGKIFDVSFADCLGAVPPSASAFKCTVTKAAAPNLTAVTGVTCSATVQ